MITFCINTARNERAYIELLLQSLLNGVDCQENNFIIFVDSDNQGTSEMLIEQKSLFPNLTIIQNIGEPIGYAGNINYMISLAKTDIVSYIQSDMVVSLGYDQAILSNMQPKRILSSTRVEPPLHCHYDNNITYVKDFGFTPETFDYSNFVEFAESVKTNRLTDFYFAPFTLYKSDWIDIGGHDVRFKKSREDSDVLVRLLLSGCKMKQTWEALVYHFTCTSSRGLNWWSAENREKDKIRQQNDQIELQRFVNKWGRFVHPTRPDEVLGLDRSKIIVENPPINCDQLITL
jgi:GT2 family glycosyltransferase